MKKYAFLSDFELGRTSDNLAKTPYKALEKAVSKNPFKRSISHRNYLCVYGENHPFGYRAVKADSVLREFVLLCARENALTAKPLYKGNELVHKKLTEWLSMKNPPAESTYWYRTGGDIASEYASDLLRHYLFNMVEQYPVFMASMHGKLTLHEALMVNHDSSKSACWITTVEGLDIDREAILNSLLSADCRFDGLI